MKKLFRIGPFCTVVLVLAACGDTPADAGNTAPPLNGTAFIDPDILSLQDPSSFGALTELGMSSRDVYDRRTDSIGSASVWLYQVDYDDGLSTEFRVNAEFDSVTAVGFADLYARRVAMLPHVLRIGVKSVTIHDGLHTFRAVDDDLVVHTVQGEAYRLQGFLEEVLAHESVHISLDAGHGSTSGWAAAQASDPTTISTFSLEFPEEDLAESFGVWLAVRWAPDGITTFLAAIIDNAVPARMAYLDAQGFNMYPVQ